jgi:hypothetical protein
MILKTCQGALSLYSNEGQFIKTLITNRVSDADINNDENMVVTLLEDGCVQLYSVQLGYIRNIRNFGAIRIRWSGNDIAIGLENGKTEIRNKSGIYLRSF